MASDLRQTIIDWLDDQYHFGEAASMIKSDDMSFMQGGILDSLGFIQLVLFLEKTFSMTINRKELSPKNFDSLGKIVAYVSAHPQYRAAR